VRVRHHGNGSKEAGVPDAVAEASTQTRSEEDRVFRRRQELERGQKQPALLSVIVRLASCLIYARAFVEYVYGCVLFQDVTVREIRGR